MNNTISYLPAFLRNVKEYKEICDTEDIEFEKLNARLDEIINEIAVDTAKGYGLERYEKIFNIVNNTTDIDERRFKIKSKLINQLPFNMKWLDNKLTKLVGAGNYSINLETDNYKITIGVSFMFPDIAEILKKDFREQLPANLVIVINLFQTEVANLYVGATVHVGDIQKILEVN